MTPDQIDRLITLSYIWTGAAIVLIPFAIAKWRSTR